LREESDGFNRLGGTCQASAEEDAQRNGGRLSGGEPSIAKGSHADGHIRKGKERRRGGKHKRGGEFANVSRDRQGEEPVRWPGTVGGKEVGISPRK